MTTAIAYKIIDGYELYIDDGYKPFLYGTYSELAELYQDISNNITVIFAEQE